ncbi:MAG: hypothetical protein ACYC2R_15190 [Burkholderiales bacterium]
MIKQYYPFLSGFHFALLQFGYLLLLQMNFSATYLTYMIISLAWISGTLAGLWWKNLPAGIALIAGIVSYGVIYGLILGYPFSSLILPLSSLGVAITGLWAGRFFILMLPVFENADQLFFRENNGFLAGIVVIFPGYAWLGTSFLLWAPVCTAAILLLHWQWLTVKQRDAATPLIEEMK